ncbi:MAG: hypothetical protein L6Q26_02520 [Anaerolineales bacterium]|nr:hypothetical protein [Anaerolineales bacterium]NUQ84612.1 hypothetical protein [Anaerolineales bacterium]
MKKRLFAPPSIDDLIQLLQAWRFWVLSGLVGALLGGLTYFVSPTDFRARATVVVDFNMEQAWLVDSDRELFYYLEREARKLEEVAWSDTTLAKVADEVGDVTVSDLRSDVLELSEPADGGWHFYANDPDPARAERLASVWAETFVAEVRDGIETAVALDAARNALASNPADEELLLRVSELETKSLGITPELQISPAQINDLNPQRRVSLANYIFAAAVIFTTLSALFILFFGTGRRA